jgi:hypothetical protein
MLVRARVGREYRAHAHWLFAVRGIDASLSRTRNDRYRPGNGAPLFVRDGISPTTDGLYMTT